MASQSAPNGKQKKKRKQKNRRTQKSHKHVIFAFFCLISAQFVVIMSMFFTTEACLFQVVTICIKWRSASSETAENESCWFRPPKSVQEEDSLFVQSNFKSTQYKDKWTVEVFRTWQVACEQKFCLLDPGSVFKDYYLHRVRSLEEKLDDLASLLAHKIRPRNC